MPDTESIRIAALGDLHTSASDQGKYDPLFTEVNDKADVLLLAGDLTHTGDEEEAEILLASMKHCRIPVVAVLGNHDYEKGREKIIRHLLQQHDNVHILDGEGVEINNIGFAGVKGFGGGFDRYMLSKFGEPELKDFVETAVEESLKLERALSRLDKNKSGIRKIALLHYAPCSQTVKGEPEAIYPFLGSSRLAEPLIRQKVDAVFHGHAHAGILEGEIAHIKVFNVAQTVLSQSGIEEHCFFYTPGTI